MPGSSPYCGRFAPSPTGPLHLGSLFTALASYLDAKAHDGQWLLRIDDLDTPRNQPGAIPAILDCLQHFGLYWDEPPVYQSQQIPHYQTALQHLNQQGLLYACQCSRKSLNQATLYPGHCRHAHYPLNGAALRIATDPRDIAFSDRIQGLINENLAQQHGDFIVRRKDQIIAYQLACVVDDKLQGINHILRGVDLLDSTPKQIYLQQCLGYPTPSYAHLPVLVDASGHKLSKQTLAAPVDNSQPVKVLWQLLDWLRLEPPVGLQTAAIAEILQWGVEHWQPQKLHKISNIQLN